jgi:hypothetical protein
MYRVADQSRSFQIAAGCLERVGVDRQGSTEHDQRRSINGALNRLLEAQPADGLNRNADCLAYGAKFVERARHPLASCGDAAAFIITNMVNDNVTAQILQPSGRRH